MSPDWMKMPAGDSRRSSSASFQLPGNWLPHRRSVQCSQAREAASVVSDFSRPSGLWQPGSSVHWILQARTLARVAVPFPRGSSQPRDHARAGYICLNRQAGSLPRAPPKPSGAPSCCQSRERSDVTPLTTPQDPGPAAPQSAKARACPGTSAPPAPAGTPSPDSRTAAPAPLSTLYSDSALSGALPRPLGS